ncbi:fish-egg lectin-like [Megalops cyprinoides]|uniref:fish-egg lectin-like n=1 Tax=Megalops cyprinoides TaxID=118141 RepID=UPI00186422E4|nr:fish-egg lectin-like [Megalops cyprinoides]
MRELWVALLLVVGCSLGQQKGGPRSVLRCQLFPGRLRQLDAGHGGVYGVGFDNQAKRLVGMCWVPLDGLMKHVSVGPSGVWGTDQQNNFYKLDEDTWTQIPGELEQVDAGGIGFLTGVKHCHLAYCADTTAGTQSFNWTLLPGKLQYQSCGPQACWGVGEAGEVYVRTGVRAGDCAGTVGLVDTKPCMAKVEVGSDGSVFGLSSIGVPYERVGISTSNPRGTGWVRLRGVEAIHSLSYDRCTLWLVNYLGQVRRCFRVPSKK